ncbi:MAG: hypothetical protein AAF984_04400 [Verrucomicrobiota bacterium]
MSEINVRGEIELQKVSYPPNQCRVQLSFTSGNEKQGYQEFIKHIPISGDKYKDTIQISGDAEKIELALYSPENILLDEKGFAGTGELADEMGSQNGIPLKYSGISETSIAPEPTVMPLAGSQRMRGKLICTDCTTVDVSGIAIALYTAESEESTPKLMAHSTTESSGYFTIEESLSAMPHTWASICGQHDQILTLDSQGNIHLPLILGLTKEQILSCKGKDHQKDKQDAKTDCACDDKAPIRNPTLEDLATTPEAFSSDLGGGKCIDFSTPNRVLEQVSFYQVVRTTDPMTRSNLDFQTYTGGFSATRNITPGNEWLALRLLDNLSGPSSPDDNKRGEAYAKGNMESVLEKSTLGQFDQRRRRSQLNGKNAILWDIPIQEASQAITVAHGHLLEYRQSWVADGYSMGDLLHSIPLAPCQKKKIAVVHWDRQDEGERDSEIEARDRLQAQIARERDIDSIASGVVKEAAVGGSAAYTGAVGGSYGASAAIPLEGALLGVTGGAAGAAALAGSLAGQYGTRGFATGLFENIKDRTLQSASSVRTQRTSTVLAYNQDEETSVMTEVIANHNHCHTLTIQYFEVLRHFQIRQELASVQECLFIPLNMEWFSDSRIIKWREHLEAALMKPEHQAGFEALERITQGHADTHLPEQRYADAPIRQLTGELQLLIDIPRPIDLDELKKDFEDGEVVSEAQKIDSLAKSIGNFFKMGKDFLFGDGIEIDKEIRRYPTAKERDRFFEEYLAPELIREVINNLIISYRDEQGNEQELAVTATLHGKYRKGQKHRVTLNVDDPGAAMPKRAEIQHIEIKSDVPLTPTSRLIVEFAHFRYSTDFNDGSLCRSRPQESIKATLKDPENATVPLQDTDIIEGATLLWCGRLNSFERRAPRLDDREKATELKSHLNRHLEYYHRAIWMRMDPQHRYLILDGYLAPGETGGMSLASAVENRVIGIVGNSLVMPVAPGLTLDPVVRELKKKEKTLQDHYAPLTPPKPFRVSVPTRGVYAEGILGNCNTCEPKDETRFWRWDEAPCPCDAPEIQPVSTDSRYQAPADLSPDQLSKPVINIQNAPQLPNPTDVGSLAASLLKGDLFRDYTGLTGNQQNAGNALREVLEAAGDSSVAASEIVKTMIPALAASQNFDKAKKALDEAVENGDMTKEKRAEILEDMTRGLMGLDPKEKNAESEAPQSSTAEDARSLAETARENDANIKVKDDDGTSFEVELLSLGVSPGTVTVPFLSWDINTKQVNKRTIITAQNAKVPMSVDLVSADPKKPVEDKLVHPRALGITQQKTASYKYEIKPKQPGLVSLYAGSSSSYFEPSFIFTPMVISSSLDKTGINVLQASFPGVDPEIIHKKILEHTKKITGNCGIFVMTDEEVQKEKLKSILGEEPIVQCKFVDDTNAKTYDDGTKVKGTTFSGKSFGVGSNYISADKLHSWYYVNIGATNYGDSIKRFCDGKLKDKFFIYDGYLNTTNKTKIEIYLQKPQAEKSLIWGSQDILNKLNRKDIAGADATITSLESSYYGRSNHLHLMVTDPLQQKTLKEEVEKTAIDIYARQTALTLAHEICHAATVTSIDTDGVNKYRVTGLGSAWETAVFSNVTGVEAHSEIKGTLMSKKGFDILDDLKAEAMKKLPQKLTIAERKKWILNYQEIEKLSRLLYINITDVDLWPLQGSYVDRSELPGENISLDIAGKDLYETLRIFYPWFPILKTPPPGYTMA